MGVDEGTGGELDQLAEGDTRGFGVPYGTAITMFTLFGNSFAGGRYGIGPDMRADMNDDGAIQLTGLVDAAGYMP